MEHFFPGFLKVGSASLMGIAALRDCHGLLVELDLHFAATPTLLTYADGDAAQGHIGALPALASLAR